MSHRFFTRFNLQSSANHFPATATIGAALQNTSPSEIQGYLDEFEAIQAARADRMRALFGDRLAPLQGKKVVFFGDSITSDNLGYRTTVSRAAHLQAVDGSISGGTSATVLQYAKERIQQEKPDLVSIMLGANDSVGIGTDDLGQVSLEEYGRNLCAIVSWSLESGARVLLFAVTPIHEARFARQFAAQGKVQSNENIQRYNQRLRIIAEELGLSLFDHGYLTDPETLLEKDGIHLSPQGQEQMAAHWLACAIDLLKSI